MSATEADASAPAAPFVIRDFRRRDAAACKRLYVESKLAANDTGCDIDDIEAAYMKSPGSHFWVAEAPDGQIIGMIGVQHHDDGVGVIRRFRVAVAHRRRGVGSALMRTALKFCEDQQYLKLTLDTVVHSEPAMRLFEKFRFRLDHAKEIGGRRLMYFYLDLYSRPRPNEGSD